MKLKASLLSTSAQSFAKCPNLLHAYHGNIWGPSAGDVLAARAKTAGVVACDAHAGGTIAVGEIEGGGIAGGTIVGAVGVRQGQAQRRLTTRDTQRGATFWQLRRRSHAEPP